MSLFRTIVSGLLLVILLFIAAPPLAAQDTEEGYAETPTSLAELVGEAGVNGTKIQFYLRHSPLGDEETVVSYTSIGAEDDHFVCKFSQRFVSNSDESIRRTFHSSVSYTLEGEFLQKSIFMQGSTDSETRTIIPNDDGVTIIRSFESTRAPGRVVEEQESALGLFEGAIPLEWKPLAIAYHLREGNEQFIIRGQGWGNEFINLSRIEDIGTETINLNGQNVQAHVLLIRISLVESDGQIICDVPEIILQQYVLADGSTIESRRESEDGDKLYESISAEDASKLLGDQNVTGDTE